MFAHACKRSPSPATKRISPAPPLPGDPHFRHGVPLLLSSVIAEGIAFLRKIHVRFHAGEILVVDFCCDRRAINASVAFSIITILPISRVYRSVSN